MGMEIVSGLPSEAVCQEDGIPFSLAIVSSDIARTTDETPIMVKTKNETQAMTRATEQIRCFMSFCLVFFDTIE